MNPVRATRWQGLTRLTIVAAVLTVSGCGSSNARRQLGSINPQERAEAIVELTDQGDRNAAAQFVALLDDDDPAVRMYAIVALEKLFGRDYGYEYYSRPAERRVAIARWQAALQSGALNRPLTDDEPPVVVPRDAAGAPPDDAASDDGGMETTDASPL